MAGRNRFRVIGGEWRGRRLPFPNVPGLRPTADAVRETLFNWLQGSIEGARCLDLFAGSGALGIEALSRGARDVIFVERSRPAAMGLKAALETLDAGGRGRVLQAHALSMLGRTVEPRDLVFLDPPFESDIIGHCCHLLAQRGWLSPSGVVYAEVDRQRGLPELPPGWAVLRQGQSGRVGFYLIATRDHKGKNHGHYSGLSGHLRPYHQRPHGSGGACRQALRHAHRRGGGLSKPQQAAHLRAS